jgi:hypothetical protein
MGKEAENNTSKPINSHKNVNQRSQRASADHVETEESKMGMMYCSIFAIWRSRLERF